jgi:hypothetical protein
MSGVIVGFFASGDSTDIPRVLTAAVKTAEGIIAADSQDDLHDAAGTAMSDEDFRELVTRGEARVSEPTTWLDDSAPYVPADSTEVIFKPLDEIERLLRAFVDECRKGGAQALRQQADHEALRLFDRARRVSNESDDYVRVCLLEAPKLRGPWREWLNTYAPSLDIEARGVALGVLPSRPLFPSAPAREPQSRAA